MGKLIDAERLKAHYCWWDNEDKEIFDQIIDLQPEAVTRCENCRYGTPYDGKYLCGILRIERRGNQFCDMGEPDRKEDYEVKDGVRIVI